MRGQNKPPCLLWTRIEDAYAHIGRPPAIGSPRYALDLNLPGLRFWPLTRYPCLVFYVECADCIDVWRVLQVHRDIPVWMQDPDTSSTG